jgi:hypothetical protein
MCQCVTCATVSHVLPVCHICCATVSHVLPVSHVPRYHMFCQCVAYVVSLYHMFCQCHVPRYHMFRQCVTYVVPLYHMFCQCHMCHFITCCATVSYMFFHSVICCASVIKCCASMSHTAGHTTSLLPWFTTLTTKRPKLHTEPIWTAPTGWTVRNSNPRSSKKLYSAPKR